MNRPKRENFKSHIEYDEFGAMEFNGIDDYYESLEKYCDELEKDNEMYYSVLFIIGEILVDESKCHLTSEQAINCIREKIGEANLKAEWEKGLMKDEKTRER